LRSALAAATTVFILAIAVRPGRGPDRDRSEPGFPRGRGWGRADPIRAEVQDDKSRRLRIGRRASQVANRSIGVRNSWVLGRRKSRSRLRHNRSSRLFAAGPSAVLDPRSVMNSVVSTSRSATPQRRASHMSFVRRTPRPSCSARGSAASTNRPCRLVQLGRPDRRRRGGRARDVS